MNTLLIAFAVFLSACASFQTLPDLKVREALAPTGTLRVGVYQGSPTSLVVDAKTGQRAGVSLEMGPLLAQKLGVPVQVVEFPRLALVLDALKTGQIDFTVTNATEARARDMDFTRPLVQLELGYLVMKDSPIALIEQIDLAGVRVGVSQGSTSQGVLTREFKNAKVVPAASLKQAQDMLKQKTIDAFATNKGILFEMSDELTGSRVLAGRWGLENLAIAIPKGRDAGRPFVNAFAEQIRENGQLQKSVQRAGLRGTTAAP
ncbi:transporter substrate-binding domain-containing protein [Limnohabitans sp. Rim28]|uniref:transporter substrate-binding domain-containing protein n=1 Tax=Limnohabitans sp. Rim28 TaxID=1100720 RepID=UPI001EDD17BC|nr:transporter substrate-binding domain-containing protein [Limnohabitans sp. Rim28]